MKPPCVEFFAPATKWVPTGHRREPRIFTPATKACRWGPRVARARSLCKGDGTQAQRSREGAVSRLSARQSSRHKNCASRHLVSRYYEYRPEHAVACVEGHMRLFWPLNELPPLRLYLYKSGRMPEADEDRRRRRAASSGLALEAKAGIWIADRIMRDENPVEAHEGQNFGYPRRSVADGEAVARIASG